MSDCMWRRRGMGGTLVTLSRSHVEAQDLWIAIARELPRSDPSTFAAIHGVVWPYVPQIFRTGRAYIFPGSRSCDDTCATFEHATRRRGRHDARRRVARAENNPEHGDDAVAECARSFVRNRAASDSSHPGQRAAMAESLR